MKPRIQPRPGEHYCRCCHEATLPTWQLVCDECFEQFRQEELALWQAELDDRNEQSKRRPGAETKKAARS